MSTLFVNVHVLQDVPPANLNRDDNGTPKTAQYGGVDRLRVSSQAWKRATRKHFLGHLAPEELGVRTRRIQGLLSDLLVARGVDVARAGEAAVAVLDKLKIKHDAGKSKLASYLLFAGRSQLAEVADAIVGALAVDDVKLDSVDVAGILGSVHPLDVALFGRMVADMTALNVDAAAQVAHALSTHAAPTQMDYFTAVDDEQGSDEAGAGMIGLVEFNSGTLYRYAVVGYEQLVNNMGDPKAAVDGIAQFIESFVHSMPSGKQNTFAAHTRPGLVLVEIRRDQPVSLVSAFENPVRAGRSGYLSESVRRLAEFQVTEAERWGDAPVLRLASYADHGDAAARTRAEAWGESLPVAELLVRVKQVLSAESGQSDA